MSAHHKKRPITGIKASFTRGAGETESVRAITGPIRVIGLVNHSAGLHNHDVICGIHTKKVGKPLSHHLHIKSNSQKAQNI